MVYRETPPIAKRKAELRERLLKSAESLVRMGGFKALTIQALATDAELSVGSVYRYFKNKDELATQVFSHATRREIRAVGEALATDGRATEQLAAGVRCFAERAFMAPQFAWALIAEPVEPAVDEARLQYRRDYTALFQQVIERGISAGEFCRQSAPLTASALVGALAESLLGPLGEAERSSDMIDELCLLCFRTVGAGN